MDLVPGTTLGSYELQEQLSSGALASVFRAYHANLDRTVVVKAFAPSFAQDPSFSSRFRHAAEAISTLRHPHILAVYDFGEQNGVAYLVTVFAVGGTLNRILGTPIPLNRAIALLRPLASALDYAHECGLVHQDIKPSNVLFDESERAVFSDFGLARIVEGSRLTQPGTILGTSEYMSPEQAFTADVGPASDLYSLGIIAYEMLVGKPPFTSDTPMATILAQMHEPLPRASERNPMLDPGVDAVLDRALSKEPENRFPTAEAMVYALEQCLVAEEQPSELTGTSVESTTVTALPTAIPPMAEESAQSRHLSSGGAGQARETVQREGYRVVGTSEAARQRQRTIAFIVVVIILLLIVVALGYLLSLPT